MYFLGSCQYTVAIVDVQHEGKIFEFLSQWRNIACLHTVASKVQSDTLQHSKVAKTHRYKQSQTIRRDRTTDREKAISAQPHTQTAPWLERSLCPWLKFSLWSSASPNQEFSHWLRLAPPQQMVIHHCSEESVSFSNQRTNRYSTLCNLFSQCMLKLGWFPRQGSQQRDTHIRIHNHTGTHTLGLADSIFALIRILISLLAASY